VRTCRALATISASSRSSPDGSEPRTDEAGTLTSRLRQRAGEGAVPLLAKSFDENGAALLIGRIAPGIALRPQDDPAGQRIARCLKRLVSVPASSVRGSLPSGLERLDALIVSNARHVRTLGSSLRRHQDRIIALADAVRGSQRPPDRAVLLHGDLHAGNLLIGGGNELVAIDPVPALGEPEQDIGDAAAKNDWGQDLSARVKQLAEACHADCTKATLMLVSRPGTPGSFTRPPEHSRREEWTPRNCSNMRPPNRDSHPSLRKLGSSGDHATGSTFRWVGKKLRRNW
jgi:streptomycin 6-kinase